MGTAYINADRNAALVASSPMAFFSINSAMPVAGGAGAATLTIYGPPIPKNQATYSGTDVAPTAAGAKRNGHRLAIWKITGGDNPSAGTRNAAFFTFKSTGTGTVIIGRVPRVVDLSTTGGWGIHACEMITPFAHLDNMPIVVGDPDEGITIVGAACGNNDATGFPVEILCSLLSTKVPTP